MKKFISIFLLLCPLLMVAQTTKQIKGQILDRTDGSPIVGATVFIDPSETGAKNYNPQGTVAGVDGRFVFTLPASVKYVAVSSLGYETLKVDISSTKDLTIRLAPQSTLVDEVVVTGYQKIEKRKLTSSIAKIDMEAINRIGVSSVDQMLEGQLAGVFTTPTSGGPGAPAKTRVRSSVTLNGTDDPLWVLDGMPLEGNEIPKDWNAKENIDNLKNMSIAGMNPDDIADITVLKDAAATAIYGARAANGVIIITTKKGARGQKTRVNASLATFITDKPNFDKLNLMNASEKVDFELSLAKNKSLRYRSNYGGVARILDANKGDRDKLIAGEPLSANGQAAIDKLRTQGTDWADEIYRLTVNQQYSLSVAGGGDKASYYFSTGYFNEQGATKGTGFERFNITLKTDFDLLKNLRFGVAMYGSTTANKSYISDQNAFTNASRYTRSVNPYLEAFKEDGSFNYDSDVSADPRGDSKTLPFNFLEESQNTNYELKNNSLKSVFDLEYKPIKSLRLYTQVGLQRENAATEKMADKQTYFVRKYALDSEVKSGESNLPDGGVIQNWNSNLFQYNWKLQAEFSHRINNVHEFDLMGGLEMRASTSKQIHTKGFGFDSKTLQTVPIYFPDNLTGTEKANSEKFKQYSNNFNENRFMSYFFTGSYTYDNRFTFFGSLRYDGSNLFGIDPKYKFTPLWSLSGAWNINREKFMRSADWISNLKLRFSYGVQGNIDRSTSPFVIGTWNNQYFWGTSNPYEPSISVTSPPNGYLRWETTDTWNAAVDFAVLDNRLSMTFEAYGRKSKNLITAQYLPQENGFESTMTNYGQLSSKGLELSISSVNVKTKSFRWATDFNIAHTSSVIDKENTPKNSFMPSRVGHSPNAIFAVKTAGLDDKGLPMFWKDGKKVSFNEFFNAGYTTIPAASIFDEETYSITYNSSAQDVRNMLTYVGNSDPKFTGGMINRFYYKNFDLSVSANFVIGQMVTRTPFYHPARTNPGENYSREMFNLWSANNPNSVYPVVVGGRPSPAPNHKPDDYSYVNEILDGFPIEIFNYFDIWTKKMNYLRINSIRVGYTLPSAISKKLHMASARFSFEARNPFVISTNYKGYFDPESYGNIYAQPLPKTFSIGLNVSF